MVKVICYRQEENWESREEAIDFYRQGVMACDGSERDRYVNVLIDLMSGKEVCTDER